MTPQPRTVKRYQLESTPSGVTGMGNPPWIRERLSGRLGDFIGLLTGVALLLGGWHVVTFLGAPPYILPTPSSVALASLQEAGVLWRETAITIQEAAYGLLIATIISGIFAVVIVHVRTVRRVLLPMLVASQVVPKVAIAPILVVWLGFGIAPKVAMVALISFFPILIGAVTGLSNLDREYIYLGQAMGGNAWGIFWRIRLPNSLPFIFAGLKVGVSLGIIGAIVGELAGSRNGIGHLILVESGKLNAPVAFAGVIYASVAAGALYILVLVAERVFASWSSTREAD